MSTYDLNGKSITRKDFTGKTFVTFGDSITWYDGHTQNGITVKGYQHYLREMGFTVTNKGVDGACLAYQSGSYTDIVETVAATDCSGYDYAFVAGGVNDYHAFYSSIGKLAASSYDNTTVIGALQIIIEKIIGDNPRIKLFLITPLREAYNNSSCDAANSKGNTLADYADAIRLVAKRYSIPVLDFNAMSGVNEKNLQRLTIDKLHPNNDGYAFLGEKLQEFVVNLETSSYAPNNDAVTVSGTTPSIVATGGKRYVCGEVSTLSFTTCANGICAVRFTSGTTPTVLTVTPPTGMTMAWPGWFDPSNLSPSATYEINVADGKFGAVMVWT